MNVIGRLTPSIESQVNLKKFRGVSTSDALYRMSGVRITGLLGSMTAIYGFSIDIFEDIQKEINDINKKLNKISEKAKILKEFQLNYEKIVEEKRKEAEKAKKEREKKEKKEKEKKGKDDKDKNKVSNADKRKTIQQNSYKFNEYDINILNDDDTIINCIEEFENSKESKFLDKYNIILKKYNDEKVKNEKKKEKDENKIKDKMKEEVESEKDEEEKNIDRIDNIINLIETGKKRTAKIEKEKEQKEKEQKEKGILNEELKVKDNKKYAYEFAYEYQYSLFEDECLKTVLKQRAEKFNFSATKSNTNQSNQLPNFTDSSNLKDALPEDQKILLEFVSMPVSDNEY